MAKSIFPKGFLWGASTAAHQVEGNTHNQWSKWEKANAKQLAETAPERLKWLQNWQELATQATDPNNYISGNAVEHYSRYIEDFHILKQLNMNSLRFSIEWSRIEPEEGKWDEKEVEHYRKYISELKKLGIEPVLTLWHWTMPLWFTDKGAFKKRQNVNYFERFVEKVIKEFGMDLRFVIILNEPNVYTSISYYKGEWPPQISSPLSFIKVYWNLVLAHRQAYKRIKQTYPEIQVGSSMNMSSNQVIDKQDILGSIAANISSYAWNRWFLNRISKQQDFIGINYYSANHFRQFKIDNPKEPKNSMGWYMEPRGIKSVLIDTWNRYKLPIIITENGVADDKDMYRKWWIEETLLAMEQAVQNGVKLRGYLHWSLLDNFEWNSGWWPKFGLVEVDRKTMSRHIRPSAKWFGQLLKKINV